MAIKVNYKIPREKAKEILSDALDRSFNTWADELDCSKSCHRQTTNKTPLEILELGLSLETTHYTFIWREVQDFGGENHWEVGLSTLSGTPAYLLWIQLNENDGLELIRKYNLKI